MPVPESLVASVVHDTSQRMSDPQFAQLAVGDFVQSQPELASYLSGRSSRIGGAQGVLEVAFHAQLLSECLRQQHGRALPRIPLRLLERASKGDVLDDLTEREPALASYVASNVDSEPVRLELSRIALALALGVVGPAPAK
jgi:hypothetical protein